MTYAEYVDAPQDFTDATGKRWVLVGPAIVGNDDPLAKGTLETDTPEQEAKYAAERESFLALSRAERRAVLAEKMRAVGLIGEPGRYFEYRAEADDEMLDRLVDNFDQPAPATPAVEVVAEQGGIKTKVFVDGVDNRVRVNPLTWWPLRASSHTYSIGFNCTLGLIGPHTAITAAHCVYRNGQGWTPPEVAIAADQDVYGNPTWTGYYYPAYWVPNAWINNPSDRTWDFALLESSSVGSLVGGWLGTRTPADNDVGYRNLAGYPGDKPDPQQWFHVYHGGLSVNSGGETMYFYNDALPGNSGGCIFDGPNYCIGIFVSQSVSANYNRAKRWTSRNYNFSPRTAADGQTSDQLESHEKSRPASGHSRNRGLQQYSQLPRGSVVVPRGLHTYPRRPAHTDGCRTHLQGEVSNNRMSRQRFRAERRFRLLRSCFRWRHLSGALVVECGSSELARLQ